MYKMYEKLFVLEFKKCIS